MSCYDWLTDLYVTKIQFVFVKFTDLLFKIKACMKD